MLQVSGASASGQCRLFRRADRAIAWDRNRRGLPPIADVDAPAGGMKVETTTVNDFETNSGRRRAPESMKSETNAH